MKNTTVHYLQKRTLDLEQYKLRSAQEADYTTLIDESCVVMDGDRVAIVYLELGDAVNCAPLVRALQGINYSTSYRTDGLVSTSKTFGYLPRNTIRRDFCTATELAVSQPQHHAVVCAYADKVAAYYRELNPDLYAQHAVATDEHVAGDYTIKGSVFTSGIINKNNPLKYHYDSGNFREVWSCMLVFKHDVEGGYLACPEYDIAFALRHNSLLMFDGQQILHGVTPIKRLSPRAYRYSVVYYSMQQMWRCEPLGAELARIRKIKTARERKRAAVIRSVDVDMHQPVRYPIFVPSKGRWKQTSMPGMLRACGLPYTLVVEPQEEAYYREDYPEASYLVLPERDRGITYVRQYILDHARAAGYERYWQLDDNIGRFVYAVNGVQTPITVNAALGSIEALVADRRSIALAGTDYAQFATLAERDVSMNTRTYCAVLTSTDTSINYRPATEMKEDVDFCLQHLAAGYDTLLSHRFAMVKPKMGAGNTGGLVAKYRAGLHNAAAEAVHRLWPGVTTLVDKKGSLDVQVDWGKFKRREATVAADGR